MLEQFSKEEIVNLYNACSKDSALFAKIFLSHIVTEIPSYHRDIYSILDKRYKYNALVLHRGAAKTTISRHIKGLQNILFMKEPVQLWISETIDQASKDLIGIQYEVDNNDLIKQFFGELKGTRWNIEEAEFSNGCYIMCKGYGSRVRGVKWKNQRPSILQMDDFESMTNSATEGQRVSVMDWINAQILPAGDENPTYQFFGTICHPDSFLARTKKMAIFQPPNGVYYERAIEHEGKPVWDKRYSKQWIKDKQDYYKDVNDMASFLQEYYNIPKMFGNVLFDVSKVNIIDASFDKYENITWLNINGQKQFVHVFIGVDPARSLASSADRTCISVVAINHLRQYILLEIFADRITPSQQIEKIFELVEKYRPQFVTIETTAYQYALADWCRQKMSEGRQPMFSINEYQRKQTKNQKFTEGLEPIINNGLMMHLPHCTGIELFKKEASYFNVDKEHDDTIDAVYLALQNSYAPMAGTDVNKLIEYKKTKKPKKQRLTWMTV